MEEVRVITRSNGMTYTLKNRNNAKAFFYPDEWKRFMSLVPEQYQMTYNILINTGARINEARNIALSDLDAYRNVITLRVTKRRGNNPPRQRRIPIPSQFKEYLLNFAKKYNMEQDDLFPVITTAGVSLMMKKYCKVIGMASWKDMSAHNIRKTFENWLHALRIEPFKIAQHLGHTLTVAAQNYVSPDTFNEADRKGMREILGDLYLIQ